MRIRLSVCVAIALCLIPDAQLQLFAGEKYQKSKDLTKNLVVGTAVEIGKAAQRHKGVVMSLAFTPDAKILASGDDRGAVRLWQFPSGKLLRQLGGCSNMTHPFAISADGKHLATFEKNTAIHVWNVQTGKTVFRRLAGYEWIPLAFAPNSNYLVAGAGLAACVWNLKTKKLVVNTPNHPSMVVAAELVAKGKKLYTLDYLMTVRSWAPGSGRFLRQHTKAQPGVLAQIPKGAFHAKKFYLAGIHTKGSVNIWAFSFGLMKRITFVPRPAWKPSAVVFDSPGKALAIISGEDTAKNTAGILVVAVAGGKIQRRLGKGMTGAKAVCFSPDGRFLVVGHTDGTIRLWRLKKDK